jgi:DNA primase
MTRRRNLSPAQRQRLEADRQRNLDRLHHRLSEQVKQLHHGQVWRDWLTVASKFHRYSWRNSLLIQMQDPDATTVAGYNAWKSLGRQVDKGQRGLQILAPITRRTTPRHDQQQPDSATSSAEEQQVQTRPPQVVGYRVTHVWDISQTSGQPLPLPPQPQLLHGQVSGRPSPNRLTTTATPSSADSARAPTGGPTSAPAPSVCAATSTPHRP